MIVIHFTAMSDTQSALTRLCDPQYEVSAHYLICDTGRVFALVPEDMRAWHAGAGAWGAVTDVNSRSIGIELANDGTQPFSEVQMRALLDLLAGIRDRWRIRAERVIGHSDCAPARKVDPGAFFDWSRLARHGHAIEVTPEPVEENTFSGDMRSAGYTATDHTTALLRALRLRHRPDATGPIDEVDLGLARALARRFPVDAHIPHA